MDVDGGCYGPHGIMGCYGYVMGFGDGGNLTHFEQATADTDIRLNDIGALSGDQIEEFKAGVE